MTEQDKKKINKECLKIFEDTACKEIYQMAKGVEAVVEYVLTKVVSLPMYGNSPVLNGVCCPECGEEMYDSTPMITLTSMPPQKNVHCSKCDYSGYRTV